MGKTKGRGRLFVLSVIDVILAIQVNVMSSGYLPNLSPSLVKSNMPLNMKGSAASERPSAYR